MLNHFNLAKQLAEQREQGCYRSLTHVSQGVTPTLTVDGNTYLNFASNDYLGLASHPAVVQSLADATRELGQVGSGASHLITGHHIWHDELATTLAVASGYERALTFSTGYMANVGVIQALCNKDTAIFSDKLNHASIIDGAILSRAQVVRFNHRDYVGLEQRLQASGAKQKLIVTDHIFSMDGTLADLAILQDLAQRYDCALMVDDAHGFGLPYQAYQATQATSAAIPKADIYIGTLGKAIGTSGAFVAGSHALIDYLINFARSYIYTTATPPALAKATQTAVQVAIADTARHQQLLANIQQLTQGLSHQGWQVGIDDKVPNTAIIPVMIGDNDKAVYLSQQLKQQGMWVSAIRPPTVPVGTARLRFCVSAAHSSQQIADLLQVMQRLQ